jgi:hypothetical protein
MLHMLSARIAFAWQRVLNLADDLFTPVMIAVVVAKVVMAVAPSVHVAERHAVVLTEMHRMQPMPLLTAVAEQDVDCDRDVDIDVDDDVDVDVDADVDAHVDVDAPCDSAVAETHRQRIYTIAHPAIARRVHVMVSAGS